MANNKKKQEQAEILNGITDKDSRTLAFEASAVIEGEKHTGRFICQFMNVKSRVKMGVRLSELLNGRAAREVDQITYMIAFATAFLENTLIQTPEWWDIDKLDYEDDLMAIYKVSADFNDTFRKPDDASANAGRSSDAAGKETVESL